ncbi:MAG: hypothetical protein IKT22_07960, partial [Prevotella sp.]|nr:hypothetical protein [Prevotella sp.]
MTKLNNRIKVFQDISAQLAGKEFFDTDKDFRPAEFMHFCSQMLVKEPKTLLYQRHVFRKL